MDVSHAVATRRSIRIYKKDAEIPREALLKILEAARLAPSAGNKQPWSFVVVKEAEAKRKVAEACNHQSFVGDASVIIVVFGDPVVSRWYAQDPMIAVEHIALEAVELGYGTCWIGAFNEDELKKILGVPQNLRVICAMPIGVPMGMPSPRGRKKVGEVFYLNTYGSPFPG